MVIPLVFTVGCATVGIPPDNEFRIASVAVPEKMLDASSPVIHWRYYNREWNYSNEYGRRRIRIRLSGTTIYNNWVGIGGHSASLGETRLKPGKYVVEVMDIKTRKRARAEFYTDKTWCVYIRISPPKITFYEERVIFM